eukprot:6308149-Amphidinium_carterae.1
MMVDFAIGRDVDVFAMGTVRTGHAVGTSASSSDVLTHSLDHMFRPLPGVVPKISSQRRPAKAPSAVVGSASLLDHPTWGLRQSLTAQ